MSTNDTQREALHRLVKWALATTHEIHFSGDHPIAVALEALASRQDQQGWRPIKTRPNSIEESYLVANASGQVAPVIRGVICNNVGTANDWGYGEHITHWMPLPAAPLPHASKETAP